MLDQLAPNWPIPSSSKPPEEHRDCLSASELRTSGPGSKIYEYFNRLPHLIMYVNIQGASADCGILKYCNSCVFITKKYIFSVHKKVVNFEDFLKTIN